MARKATLSQVEADIMSAIRMREQEAQWSRMRKLREETRESVAAQIAAMPPLTVTVEWCW